MTLRHYDVLPIPLEDPEHTLNALEERAEAFRNEALDGRLSADALVTTEKLEIVADAAERAFLRASAKLSDRKANCLEVVCDQIDVEQGVLTLPTRAISLWHIRAANRQIRYYNTDNGIDVPEYGTIGNLPHAARMISGAYLLRLYGEQ